MAERVSDAQELIIDDLDRKVAQLKKHIETNKKQIAVKEPKATFYMKMQKTIEANPELVDEWAAFLILIKFTLSRSIRGITEAN